MLLERTCVADVSLGPVHGSMGEVVVGTPREHLAVGADVDVETWVVFEVAGSIKAGVFEIVVGQRHVGSDSRFLDGGDVLVSTVPGVSSDVVWPQAPAEARPP